MANGQNKQRRERIIKEGGYQPTQDPGPVPTSMVRPATEKPPESKPTPAQGKK